MRDNKISRRTLLASSVGGVLGLASCVGAATQVKDDLHRRTKGMLLGSLIGDAAGGPVEFRNPAELRNVLPGARFWSDDARLTDDRLREIAGDFRLLSYAELRPQPEPYAHWTKDAEPGTITDDSRHKIPLLDALRKARDAHRLPISPSDLANEYVGFESSARILARPHYQSLCREGFEEYVRAARWVLGERDLGRAAPVQRLWAGVATNAGQMALLPLGAARARNPDAAYRAAYQLGFMDNGPAKDINASVVAGLAHVIGHGERNPEWEKVIAKMKQVDPFGYGEIPFVQRPTSRWLDKASALAKRAAGRPKELYRLLEQEGSPRYYWDAHFVLLTVFSVLELCKFDPLSALHLSIDFGHDTDSSAQLLGAFVGAMHGPEVFPAPMRNKVRDRLTADYDESVDEWTDLLVSLSDEQQYPRLTIGHTP